MTTTLDSRAVRARDLLITSVCFALATGLLHVAILWVRRYGLHQFTWSSRELIWMSPLAYLGFFLATATVIAVVGLAWRPVSQATVVLIDAFLMVFALLLLFPRISQWASMVLAAGVAFQLSRAVGKRPAAWQRRFLIGVPVLGAVVLIGSVAVHVSRWATERRMMAELPEPPANAPNVLLLILDTVRAANLSLYGYARPTTPHLKEWAKQSAVFDYAIATAPWSLPSHASFFTGRPAYELGTGFLDPLDTDVTTLTEVLRKAGYATGAFAANYYYGHTESGLEQGFAHYEDYPITAKQVIFSSSFGQAPIFTKSLLAVTRDRSIRKVGQALREFEWIPSSAYPSNDRKTAAQVDAAFLRWRSGLGRRPWFAFVNYFDAHANYKPSPAFVHSFSSSPNDVDLYDAAIADIDNEIDRMLRTMQQHGELDNTIVVVMSDHGEQFGERGLLEHGNSVYTQLLRVPLMIRYPRRVPGGVRVAQVASLRHIPATVLDLVTPSTGTRIAPGALPGTSLRLLWEGQWPDSLQGAQSYLRVVNRVSRRESIDLSVFDDSLHFIQSMVRLGPNEASEDGRRESTTEHLFRYRTDSTEMDDLQQSAMGEALARAYRALLPLVTLDRPVVRTAARAR